MVGSPMRPWWNSRGAKVVSAGGFPVGLELGTERCGEDLAQHPIPARPWHEEVGLGVVEHDERDGADLDHIVPVQCDLREDPRRGLFRPGLVKEEVADAVEDRLALINFDPLGPVGVVSDNEVGSGIQGGVCEIHLLRFWGRHILLAPMWHYEDQVDTRTQALYVLLHDVLKEWRRTRVRLGSPGPAVRGDVQVREDTDPHSTKVEQHWLASLRYVHACPCVGYSGVIQMAHRLVHPCSTCIQNVIVAQGNAIQTGLI